MDAPLRFFSSIDSTLMGVLPAPLRIVLWAAVAAFVSMEIYRVLSPQDRIRRLEERIVRARASLDAHEGNFSEGWAVVRETLHLALKRLGLVAPAAIAATLPLFAIVLWMSNTYENERVIGVGPSWADGWELIFFIAVSASAFAAKALRGIA